MMKFTLTLLLLGGLAAVSPAFAADEKKDDAKPAETKPADAKPDEKKDDKTGKKELDDKEIEKLKKEAEKMTEKLKGDAKTKLMGLLNKGSDDDIKAIRGIGEAKLEAIKKARPVGKLEDLITVDGLGKGAIRDLVEFATSPKFMKDDSKDKKKPDKKTK